MSRMIVAYYGKLGELVGRETAIELTPDVRTVGDLRRFLAGRHPSAASELLGPRLRVALGDRIVSDDDALGENERAEFFPPLSGG